MHGLGEGGSYIVIRNIMAAFRESIVGLHVQLHINAHAADGIESHMKSPLVCHIYIECLGSLPSFMTCRGSMGGEWWPHHICRPRDYNIPTHRDHTVTIPHPS